MKRGFTAAEIGVLRKRPQASRWYMALHKPERLAQFTINWSGVSSKTMSYLTSINLIEVSGGENVNREGLTAWISSVQGGSFGASNLGIVRIRHPWAGTSTSKLWFDETGSGAINWTSANFVTVIDQYLPWPKKPRYDTTASQWRIDYDDVYDVDQYNSQVSGPYANMDANWVGFMESGAYGASFIGGSSLAWDCDLASYSWVFPDGVTDLDLGTEASPVRRSFGSAYPGGCYVHMKLVDDCGASVEGHRLLFIFNDRHEVPRVSFAEIQGGYEEGGYKARIGVHGYIDEFEMHTGNEIIIFEEASYNDSACTLGGNNILGTNIVFRGWLSNENIIINPLNRSQAIIEATTIDGYAEKLSSYDVFLAEASAGPTGASHWIETTDLSLDRVALYILKHRSTLGNIVNFFPASDVITMDGPMRFQDLPRNSLWQQLRANYHEKGYLGYISSDLQSNLFSFDDINVTGLSNTKPLIMSLSPVDRRDTMTIDWQIYDRNAQVQLLAVADETPLGGESPGIAIGNYGTAIEYSEGLLVDTQDRLITWAGNLRAKLNSRYPHTVIPLAGNYRIDPVPQTRLNIPLSPVENARGVGWSGIKSFHPKRLRLNYNAVQGAVVSEIEVEEVVNGAGGSAITFPTPDGVIPLGTDPPDPPILGAGAGLGTAYVMTSDGLDRTRKLGDTTPTWNGSDIGPNAGGAGATYWDFILDPWNPANIGYLSTDQGVYKTTNLNSSSPSWTLVLSATTVQSETSNTGYADAYKVMGSINVQDFVVVFYTLNTGGDSRKLYCSRSVDGGTNWTHIQISDDYETGATNLFRGAADIVPGTAVATTIKLYAAYIGYVTSPAAFTIYLHKSTDGGATWDAGTAVDGPEASFPTNGVTRVIHVPYHANTNGNIFFIGAHDDDGTWGLYKSTDGGSTYTTLSQDTNVTRHGVESYTQNQQRVFVWNDSNQLFISTDGGTTLVQESATGVSGTVTGAGGFPFNSKLFYVVTSAGIFVSTDGGVTFSDKTNNFGPTLDSNPTVIVPVWTE